MQSCRKYGIIIRKTGLADGNTKVLYPYSTNILTKNRADCNEKLYKNAAVVKLADAPDSKSGGLILRVGSSPTSGTKTKGATAPFVLCLKTKNYGEGREPKVRAKPCVAKNRKAATDRRHQNKGSNRSLCFILKKEEALATFFFTFRKIIFLKFSKRDI